MIFHMGTKQQSGGRELNKISAPALFHFKPVFYCQTKVENQQAFGELVGLREPVWHHRPARIFNQTCNLSNL
jgi:hypothetical protein